MREPILEARTQIEVPLEAARSWFLGLDRHPERYEFGTHEGFEFTQGAFGEPGARFQTEEIFMGVQRRLKFELTEVNQTQFTFHVISPIRSIWGYFALDPIDTRTTRLRLAIGSEKKTRRLFLRLPIIRSAVGHQIQREVEHIKASMEEIYGSQSRQTT